MKSSVNVSEKKVYQAPKLLKYGNLTEMTTANTLRGMKDSLRPASKTG